jgi:hypothetical protein
VKGLELHGLRVLAVREGDVVERHEGTAPGLVGLDEGVVLIRFLS